VPAIAGGAVAGDAATTLLAAGADTSAATRLLPAAGEEDAEATTEKKKRSPWTWPLIALIALLLLVLIGTLWAVFANQGGDPEPTGTKSSSASPTPTDTPTPTPTTANVVAADYIGLDCNAASAALDALGLGANCVEGNAAPDQASEGKVYSVNPQGNVPKDTIIDLTVYAGQVPMTQPGAPTLPGTVTAGSTTQVQWSGYSCPSGTGSVSAYNLTATNGVFPSTGQSTAAFGPNDRAGQIQVTGAAGQALIVTYTVTCSGGSAGDRTSGASPDASSQIEAAGPTPTPTP
nr:PASTA domain-containing protein [Actinomycetota bacterium]